MSTDDLSPPGSSEYSSATLHVGDGTWDSSRDDFLLPNLVGLNFATMQYNGMGNRFRGLPQYHTLILGHGVLAAITFLGIVPAAVFLAKYGFFDRRRSMKLHVYLQILTVFLSTVILILGWFAVGPERSLTNPHHGIGVAIYVMVLVQFLYGWMMARLERKRKNPMALTRLPMKVWLHKLFGRTIALLAFVQIPLGLTLYGSPKALFILYALAGAFLVFLYLALDRYYFEKRPVEFGIPGARGREQYSDYGSYLSGSRTDLTQDPRRDPARNRHHWGRDLLAAGGLLGAYEAYQHRRGRKREELEQAELDAERRHAQRPPPGLSGGRPPGGPPVSGPYAPGPGTPAGAAMGRPPMRPPNARFQNSPNRMSPESWDEKYDERPPAQHTWRDRLLGVGAGVVAFEGVKGIFNRKRRQNDNYGEAGSYRPPLGGNQNMVSQSDVSRVQAGHAPFSPGTPGGGVRNDHTNATAASESLMTPSRPSRNPRPSGETLSYDGDESVGGGGYYEEDQNHTLRNSIAALGAFAGFREWSKHRRERREQQRADRLRRQEMENEETYNRQNAMTYPRPEHAGRQRPSMSGTIMTGATGPGDPGFAGSNPELARPGFGQSQSHTGPPDTMHPPLPADAGTVTNSHGPLPPPGAFGPDLNRPSPQSQNFTQSQSQNVNVGQGYQLPPPPPGPPPNMNRPQEYQAPAPGSLQMPTGAVNPDPSRLVSQENVAQQSGHLGRDAAAAGLVGAAAGAVASGRNHSPSPSRYHSRQDSRTRLQRPERRGSVTSASATNTGIASAAGNSNTPPVTLHVKPHNDGRHVTVRRLNEAEAAAQRSARRDERRQRRSRRASSLSSGLEDDSSAPNPRYRRNGGMRRSSDQPITNVPPPPAMSSTAGSHRPPSELNLPPAVAPPPPRVPPHTATPPSLQASPNAPPVGGSGMGGSGVGSPGDAGTGTDLSTFADNARRRRAERARRLEAARGAGGNRVEFS